MKKIVFTNEFCGTEHLFPFTLTRHMQDIRVGIFTIREKWEQQLGFPSFDKYEGNYMDGDRSVAINETIGDDDTLYLIPGNLLPSPKLIKQVKKLKPGQFLSVPEKSAVVYCISKKQVVDENQLEADKAVEVPDELRFINYPWDLFQINNWAIAQDFEVARRKNRRQTIPSSNKTIKAQDIIIEKGAYIEHCTVNATEGPVYIGRNAVVMEGCLLRGPVAIGERAVVKMGAKIYGATTIGPNCTVGGEIKNSIFFGNSNKAHDGYLGDSVIGEWCNLGAGTSNSNIKNNASGITVYTPDGPVSAGTKCGVLMGDYSRTAINTSINTGTVIGVCCNVFGAGLTPKYIPSFSWGTDGRTRYEFAKALADIDNWKTLKKQHITDNENAILRHIFENY